VTGKSEARWRAEPYPYERAVVLASELGVSHTTAAVLVRRGLADVPAARSFLDGAEQHDPDLFAGIDRAVEVVMRHVAGGTPIAIHGDYDVDGVCSAAVLASALEALGASVHVRLPSRDEGYGLSVARVEELHAAGARLLITTDCGITACAEVDRAIALGMDMVVTDHHRPAATLPACPVVHPSVCGYPAELCATGVAYKFAQALYAAAGRDPAELEPQLDLVALATVADLVPLVGENRALVKQGLRAIAGTSRPGLRALLRVTAVDPQSVTEQTLGFALAPRINAAGRLYRADAALELVLTRDEDRALEIARELDAVNAERQSVETAILFEAERLLSEQGVTGSGGAADPLYVLAHQDWHPGVIGIVASRLVDRYHRPFVMVAMSESGDGRGSGRSIRPYDLHAGLAATADHLEGFGGHRMAAGLQVRAERLDDFRAGLVDHARSCLSPADLVKVEHVDAVVPGDALGLDLAEELQSLRPFGMGNPAINVLVPAAKVSDVRPMGGGRHVRFSVTSGGLRSRAVGFGITPGSGALGNGGTRHDLAARLEANEWQGAVEPRLVVRSLHPVEEPEACEGAGGCSSCACRMDDTEWWNAVWTAYERQEPTSLRTANCELRTIQDHRNKGALGVLGDLMSTGESLLVICADVSRRSAVLIRDLDASRFARRPWTRLSAHCAAAAAKDPTDLVLADHGAVAAAPALAERFAHLFALDPPASAAAHARLEHSGPGFLHLGWGPAEVEFTQAVVEHQHHLRPHLTEIYRALGSLDPPGSPIPRSALEGDGRHPRAAALAGSCMRVLAELDLAKFQVSSGTVSCTITNGKRVELERSETFRACSAAGEEGLRYLSSLTPRAPSARAA
jgi:single-stranded-DNA-specific exonuclease